MGEDDRLMVADDLRIPRFELHETFSASGGPGGQHANKAASRVELTFDPAVSSAFPNEDQRARVVAQLGAPIRVVVDDERSQLRNRADRRTTARRPAPRGAPCRASEAVDEADPWIPATTSQSKARRSEVKRQRRRPDVDD